MNTILNTHLKKFCPDKSEVDLSGKKQEYQGIVLLPFIEQKTVQKVYEEYIEKMDEKELKRNVLGKSVIYKYNPSVSKMFYSYYGNIPNCMAEYRIVEL
jgi:5'-3' exoribonuclease 1